MRSLLVFMLLVCAVAAGLLIALLGEPTGVRGAGDCTVADGDLALDSEERAFLALLNQYRQQNGAGPLIASVNLDRAAAWMSRDLATSGAPFSHTSSDGRSPFQRMSDCGYPTSGNGENLAGGFFSAQSVLDAWKASPGHNANMLQPSYRQIGIGRHVGGPYGVYWTNDFASHDDGTNALDTPTPHTGTLTPAGTPTGVSTATATRTATSTPTRSPTATRTPTPDYRRLPWCERRPSLGICVIGIYAARD